MSETISPLTGEEATKRGYRRVSNKYHKAARIDRPDWVTYMARHLNRAPADFYRPGELNVSEGWCDYYLRTLSLDVITLAPEEFRKLPRAMSEPMVMEYVPVEPLRPVEFSYKYVVIVRYNDGELDALSVWDTEDEAHADRKALADTFPSNRYTVRMTRHNISYLVE